MALSHLVEGLLIAGGAGHLGRRRVAGRKLILAYHNIVAEGEDAGPDRSLHLPRKSFASQLDLLQATHDVLPLPDLVAYQGSSSRPLVAITFDDAYRGAVTSGIAELHKRGLPATVFVSPAFVGGGAFWWDALRLSPGVDPEPVRDFVLRELGGRTDQARRWAEQAGHAWREPNARAASEDELLAISGKPGITLASHTWSHPNLTTCNQEELREELERPMAWLRERFASVLPWLAYPYGMGNEVVKTAAACAGYAGSLRVTGGWMPRPFSGTFDLPRWNVSGGIRLTNFTLRTAGIFCR
jgi:peptidoglycan/xylan/chitin deacetylase (PgdA/CDA1 family)